MTYQYINLAIGAPARLAILRRNAAEWDAKYPHARLISPTWRQVRFATLTNTRGLSQGANDDGPVWYTHDGPAFPQWYVDEIGTSAMQRHKGYFTDSDCCATARGIVARLPHGRFLAGYYMSDNGENVYYPEIYTYLLEACYAADTHAERFAEAEREHHARFEQATALEDELSDHLPPLRRALALRNDRRPCFADSRAYAKKLIRRIKEVRRILATEYAGVL